MGTRTDINGALALINKVQDVCDKLLDMRPDLLEPAGNLLLEDTLANVNASVGFNKTRLRKLSKLTLKLEGEDRKPLEGLEATINLTILPRTIIVGSSHPHANQIQNGAPNNKAFGRGNAPIPARPFLGLSKKMRALMTQSIIDEILKPLRQFTK